MWFYHFFLNIKSLFNLEGNDVIFNSENIHIWLLRTKTCTNSEEALIIASGSDKRWSRNRNSEWKCIVFCFNAFVPWITRNNYWNKPLVNNNYTLFYENKNRQQLSIISHCKTPPLRSDLLPVFDNIMLCMLENLYRFYFCFLFLFFSCFKLYWVMPDWYNAGLNDFKTEQLLWAA